MRYAGLLVFIAGCAGPPRVPPVSPGPPDCPECPECPEPGPPELTEWKAFRGCMFGPGKGCLEWWRRGPYWYRTRDPQMGDTMTAAEYLEFDGGGRYVPGDPVRDWHTSCTVPTHVSFDGWTVCHEEHDKDGDGDIDLVDLALWQRRAVRID